MICATRCSRLALPLAALLLAVLFAGCAAPSTATSASAPAPATQTPEAMPPPAQAPPMSDPLPAEQVPSPVRIDRSCRVDADCAVKDVGNCCGAMPACVNVNSPTDPQGVQDACAKSGRMGVCGFRQIESCQCVQGQCKEQASALEQGPEQVR